MTMPMLRSALRICLTLLVVAAAGALAHWMWTFYQVDPWTRDGRVRADIVQIAPDVSGLVKTVHVRDNQHVRAGAPLFTIDRARFVLALQQAEAMVANRRATWQQAVRDRDRYARLPDGAVSRQQQEQTAAAALEAEAAFRQAAADRNVAQLNLERTVVSAPVDGAISNLDLRPGDYVTAGKPAFALIDRDSIRIEGYFEESKLPRIHIGDPVRIRLMGEEETLSGHVESIAAGIEDRERSSSSSLLANVNPTFSWVRLAQRVPVRIALDQTSNDIRLVVGRTATVEVLPKAVAAVD